MTLRPYKFQVVAVVQEVDDDGAVVAERSSDVATLFGVDGLAKWAEEFESYLADAAEGLIAQAG